MVAATAGTTNAGMIDPLLPIRQIATDYGLWYHVDAAWGGAICVSPMHEAMMSGVETSDSITLDAHKWLAVPMGAGVILCRDQEILSSTFGIETSYMPEGVAGRRSLLEFGPMVAAIHGLQTLPLPRCSGKGWLCSDDRAEYRTCHEAVWPARSGGEWRVVNNPSPCNGLLCRSTIWCRAAAVAKHVVEAGGGLDLGRPFRGTPPPAAQYQPATGLQRPTSTDWSTP